MPKPMTVEEFKSMRAPPDIAAMVEMTNHALSMAAKAGSSSLSLSYDALGLPTDRELRHLIDAYKQVGWSIESCADKFTMSVDD